MARDIQNPCIMRSMTTGGGNSKGSGWADIGGYFSPAGSGHDFGYAFTVLLGSRRKGSAARRTLLLCTACATPVVRLPFPFTSVQSPRRKQYGLFPEVGGVLRYRHCRGCRAACSGRGGTRPADQTRVH